MTDVTGRAARPRRRLLPAAAAGMLLLTGTLLAGCGTVLRHWAQRHAAAPQASLVGSPLPAGSTAQVIWVHGVRRTYRVYRPARLAGPAPLVVMLHGGFGTGAQAERSYHWDAHADAAHFVVAYPDGLDRAWNAGGGCCGSPGGPASTMSASSPRWSRPSSARSDRPAPGLRHRHLQRRHARLPARLRRPRIFAAIGPDSATQLGGCRPRRRSP